MVSGDFGGDDGGGGLLELGCSEGLTEVSAAVTGWFSGVAVVGFRVSVARVLGSGDSDVAMILQRIGSEVSANCEVFVFRSFETLFPVPEFGSQHNRVMFTNKSCT